MHRWLAILLTSCGACAAVAQAPSPADPARPVSAAGIAGVVAPGTPVRLLRAGFDGTDGVIAMRDGSMLFCELNQSRVIHLDLKGEFSTYLENANRATGLAFDRRGRLIAAESRDPRIEVLWPRRVTLADTFDGQPLVRPNDLVVDRKGGIYFSDPLPTPQSQFRDPPPGRVPLLFYITPGGKVTRLTTEVSRPNGVQLSTDEKILYAIDGDRVVAFDVQQDGSVRNLRPFVDVAGGDGMAVDSADRVYIATEAGVEVVDVRGRRLGLIPTPVRMQSVAFGGRDHRTLYIVGRGAVYQVRMLTQGVRGRAK